MCWETHSTDQGKMHNYVQGSNGPLDSLTWQGMQPTSKVTRHQSVATPSQWIRHVHEDPRAHQSYQTNLRQALNHIYDMGVRLTAFRPRTGPNGPSPRSADQQGRPTWCWQATGPTDSHRTCGNVWLVFHGGLAQFSSKRLVVPPIYMRGGGSNEDTHTLH